MRSWTTSSGPPSPAASSETRSSVIGPWGRIRVGNPSTAIFGLGSPRRTRWASEGLPRRASMAKVSVRRGLRVPLLIRAKASLAEFSLASSPDFQCVYCILLLVRSIANPLHHDRRGRHLLSVGRVQQSHALHLRGED